MAVSDHMAVRELESTPEMAREAALEAWARANRMDLGHFEPAQRWLLWFALQWVDWAGAVAPLRRLIGAMLAYTGLLSTTTIGMLTGVSDRAVRKTRSVQPEALIESLRPGKVGAKSKLKPEHAGPVAKFLAEHPGTRQQDVLDHIQSTLGISVDRLTLRRFLDRYGLGCLRDERIQEHAPFLDTLNTAEPSC